MEIKSWEDYFLDLAKTCASRSNCLRAQVGAVIVLQCTFGDTTLFVFCVRDLLFSLV